MLLWKSERLSLRDGKLNSHNFHIKDDVLGEENERISIG